MGTFMTVGIYVDKYDLHLNDRGSVSGGEQCTFAGAAVSECLVIVEAFSDSIACGRSVLWPWPSRCLQPVDR